jgi:hypothetical protein
MKRAVWLTAIPVLVFLVPGYIPSVHAQAKTARGTVSAVSSDSVTVKVADKDMVFSVDAKTAVEAPGAGRRTRDAQSQGQAGAKVTDLLKTGQAVQVSYTETGGKMHASRIRAISSAGSGGGSVSTPAPAAKSATGTVKAVSATSLTVSGAGGKDMAFTVDASTRVVGQGAGTAARAGGGRIAITEVVKNGDNVRVAYDDAGGGMKATEVRVVAKGAVR